MPKQVDHEQRRRQLAEALWAVIDRDGIDAVSVRHVAHEAQVSPGLVQHYFPSKDDLLRFALELIGKQHGERLIAKVGALPEPRDPMAVIRMVLHDRLPTDDAGMRYVQFAIAWLAKGTMAPDAQEYLRAGTAVLRDYLAGQLRTGQEAGVVRTTADPGRSAAALLALVEGLAANMVSGLHDADSALAVLEEQLALLTNG